MILDADFLKLLEYLDVIARKRFRGIQRGERQSRRRGSSAEFLDHRPYTPGDDLRHLDWNVYHRFEELILKLYREEENLDLTVLLDTSASMNLPGTSKREYAIKLAAAIAYIGMSNLDRSYVQPFSAAMAERSFTGAGKGRVWELFKFLEELEFDGLTNLTLSTGQFTSRAKRKGVVVLISDFYDTRGATAALRILRGRRNDVGVIHLYDPVEENPPLRGELRLIDRETRDHREVTVTERLRRRYTEAFLENRARVADLARRYEIGFTPADTSTEFTQLMTEVINSGGVVG